MPQFWLFTVSILVSLCPVVIQIDALTGSFTNMFISILIFNLKGFKSSPVYNL